MTGLGSWPHGDPPLTSGMGLGVLLPGERAHHPHQGAMEGNVSPENLYVEA